MPKKIKKKLRNMIDKKSFIVYLPNCLKNNKYIENIEKHDRTSMQ